MNGHVGNLADVNVPAQPPQHLFQNSIFIPGLLHILHNAMKTVSTFLPYYALFEGQLKTMADFVTFQTLELFIQKCIEGTPFTSAKHLFSRNTFPKRIEWRWGTNGAFIEGLLRVMKVLRAAWRTERMLSGDW